MRSRHEEDDIQVTVIKRAELHYPELAKRLHHSPNGGKRNAREAGRFKAMGVRPGFPDLILPVATTLYDGGNRVPGLVIEIKTVRGRLTTPQTEWLDFFEAQGWAAYCCYGLDAVWSRLDWYCKRASKAQAEKRPQQSMASEEER